jgi:hypothetical protein
MLTPEYQASTDNGKLSSVAFPILDNDLGARKDSALPKIDMEPIRKAGHDSDPTEDDGSQDEKAIPYCRSMRLTAISGQARSAVDVPALCSGHRQHL